MIVTEYYFVSSASGQSSCSICSNTCTWKYKTKQPIINDKHPADKLDLWKVKSAKNRNHKKGK